MSAVKIGYVVVYRNPPEQKGLDSFLVVSTPNNVVKRSTDGSLERATVFEERAAAEAFLALDPKVGDRTGEVCEVHQVTHRKLAYSGDSLKDSLKAVQERKGWPRPSALNYAAELVAPPQPPPETERHIQSILAEIPWADSNTEPADGHAPKSAP